MTERRREGRKHQTWAEQRAPSERVHVERRAGDAWVKEAQVDDAVVASALAKARRLHADAQRAVKANRYRRR